MQGLAALAVHDPLRRFDDDVVAMTDAAGHTRHGHLVVADRDGVTSAGCARPGDVLGLIDGDVARDRRRRWPRWPRSSWTGWWRAAASW